MTSKTQMPTVIVLINLEREHSHKAQNSHLPGYAEKANSAKKDRYI